MSCNFEKMPIYDLSIYIQILVNNIIYISMRVRAHARKANVNQGFV